MTVVFSRTPTPVAAKEARAAARALERAAPAEGAADVRVQATGEPDAVTLTVPREAFDLFVEVLDQLANGHAVAVVPVHKELTTHQAAALLGVSRPFLIGLLDAGAIRFRRVGSHRRILFADLMTYRQQDDARRDEALAELTRQAQDLGLGY